LFDLVELPSKILLRTRVNRKLQSLIQAQQEKAHITRF